VGIAMCAGGFDTSADAILGDADRAMYEAKRKGRNGFRFAPVLADSAAHSTNYRREVFTMRN
jgi:hypothetical protein